MVNLFFKERWGSSKSYQEYGQKEKAGHDFSSTANEMMTLFVELGTFKQRSSEDKIVQNKISDLQNFITSNYYNCTTDILNGLGKLYVDDERLKQNIDKAGGEGTAEFVKKAIEIYCSKL